MVIGHTVDGYTVALWKMDESSSNVANYQNSYALNNATYDLAPASSAVRPDISGGPNPDGSQFARWFDGIDNRLDGATDANLRAIFTNSYSIETWIYWEGFTDTAGVIFIVSGDTGSATSANNILSQLAIVGSGNLRVFWEYSTGSTQSYTDTTLLSERVWTHVGLVVTDQGSTYDVDFYVNGTFSSGTTGLTPPDGGSSSIITIGGQFGGTAAYFNGAIADIRLSNTNRDSTEIAASAAAYQHTNDGYAYEIWRLNEEPEVKSSGSNLDCWIHLSPGPSYTPPDIVRGFFGVADYYRYQSSADTNQYLTFAKRQELATIFDGDFTLEGWWQRQDEATGDMGLFNYGVVSEAAEANSFNLLVTTGRTVQVIWEHSVGTDVTGTSTATLWESQGGQNKHHLAITKYHAGGGLYTCELYIDGVYQEDIISSGTNSEIGNSETMMLFIGYNLSDRLNGSYSDIRLSNKRRTASEILESYNNGLTVGSSSSITFSYIMQAEDSITGQVYRWPSSTRDYAGTGYPGPNSPIEISVIMQRKITT